MPGRFTSSYLVLLSLLLLSASLVAGGCSSDHEETIKHAKTTTLRYKFGAIAAILLAGNLGLSMPMIGKNFPALHPESNFVFLVKSFAAGVILCTAFNHILPDAFKDLTNPCLNKPWGDFPFTGLFATVGALVSLIVDAFATTGLYRSTAVDGEINGQAAEPTPELDSTRYRFTSEVLEMGIVVHSAITGISLGTSQSLDTINPLMAALCFHQFFEGVGLPRCIVQEATFPVTTPVGIAIGIRIINRYDESSPSALIVQGMLNAIASGILIYTALVHLLAQDFMNAKVQTNILRFFGANISLLLGAACMVVLAIWA